MTSTVSSPAARWPEADTAHRGDLVAAAARAGLDFFVRNQCADPHSADHGRFPFIYDCRRHHVKEWTTGWITGVVVEAMLAGHQRFGEPAYLKAAQRAVAYLSALQEFSPTITAPMYGAFREETPQSIWMHPRDSLTVAWALLDYAQVTGNHECYQRAVLFGDWFVKHAILDGYPYWTGRFDDQPWEPAWFGSFHSGSAYFMGRLYQATGDQRFAAAMRSILDHYNRHHLDEDGRVTVIRDRATLAALDGRVTDSMWTYRQWEVMHVYNDDFGALANLMAYRIDGERAYRDAAERFLRRMLRVQRGDGGFGPADYSVPSAGGAVLIELAAAQDAGLELDAAEAIEQTVHYLLQIQIHRPGDPEDGAFCCLDAENVLDREVGNSRCGAYAILALLRQGGAIAPHYAI